ncbi:LysR family transcriptional regulator [Kitasatospora sp. NBC_01250]|uniref:LysR family transcriptional regulator n=1 Tax=Kitasatospora sp. NBC_01250 TaxID=2903571 RepID=UPI002E377F6C|nr:LysR family transcriptional regulator [Kitasatospora sp. NBC_01250]
MRVTQSNLDLNLLLALDVLIEESSVRGAAARLHLSEPAMSRTLGRIRAALGDPVLVRAGRGMVPTPGALAIHADVRELVERARALFLSTGHTDVRTALRTFTAIAYDGLPAMLLPALLARVRAEAPGVRLRFLTEGHQDDPVLREGVADLEIGVIDNQLPEVRVEHLYDERMVGVVRAGHPLLAAAVTPERFAAAEHLIVSRRARMQGPVDRALRDLGLTRTVCATVGSLSSSLFVLRETDLVGLIPGQNRALAQALDLTTFPLPLPLPPLPFGMAWHPRHDADTTHRWLRTAVRELLLDRFEDPGPA